MGPMGCSANELKIIFTILRMIGRMSYYWIAGPKGRRTNVGSNLKANGFSDKWTVRPKRRQTNGLNALDYWTIEPLGCSTNGTNM